jgi:hypothetical protein
VRPIGWVGAALILIGGLVIVLGGVSYVRDREEVQVGPIEIAAEERGFISPLAGAAVLGVGVVLVVVGRRRS